jgi:hypothetical protein
VQQAKQQCPIDINEDGMIHENKMGIKKSNHLQKISLNLENQW